MHVRPDIITSVLLEPQSRDRNITTGSEARCMCRHNLNIESAKRMLKLPTADGNMLVHTGDMPGDFLLIFNREGSLTTMEIFIFQFRLLAYSSRTTLQFWLVSCPVQILIRRCVIFDRRTLKRQWN